MQFVFIDHQIAFQYFQFPRDIKKSSILLESTFATRAYVLQRSRSRSKYSQRRVALKIMFRIQGYTAALNYFPATCPMKFNKLNSV